MTILFLILIILASVVLGFIVLVQNPKGGGLAGSFAGLQQPVYGCKTNHGCAGKRNLDICRRYRRIMPCFYIFYFRSASGTNTKVPEAAAPASQQQPTPPNTATPLQQLHLHPNK